MEYNRKEKELMSRVEQLSKAFDNLVSERNHLIAQYDELQENYHKLCVLRIDELLKQIEKYHAVRPTTKSKARSVSRFSGRTY